MHSILSCTLGLGTLTTSSSTLSSSTSGIDATQRKEIAAFLGIDNDLSGKSNLDINNMLIEAFNTNAYRYGAELELSKFTFTVPNGERCVVPDCVKLDDCSLSGGDMAFSNGKLTAAVEGSTAIATGKSAIACSINGAMAVASGEHASAVARGHGSTAFATAPFSEARSYERGKAYAQAAMSTAVAYSKSNAYAVDFRSLRKTLEVYPSFKSTIAAKLQMQQTVFNERLTATQGPVTGVRSEVSGPKAMTLSQTGFAQAAGFSAKAVASAVGSQGYAMMGATASAEADKTFVKAGLGGLAEARVPGSTAAASGHPDFATTAVCYGTGTRAEAFYRRSIAISYGAGARADAFEDAIAVGFDGSNAIAHGNASMVDGGSSEFPLVVMDSTAIAGLSESPDVDISSSGVTIDLIK